jgi:hypothetical protein
MLYVCLRQDTAPVHGAANGTRSRSVFRRSITTMRTTAKPLQESWSERTTTRPGVCISLLSAAYCDLFVMPSRTSPLVDASSQILVRQLRRGKTAPLHASSHTQGTAARMRSPGSTNSLLSTASLVHHHAGRPDCNYEPAITEAIVVVHAVALHRSRNSRNRVLDETVPGLIFELLT